MTTIKHTTEWRKNNLERHREICRKSQKKRYERVGKKYQYNYINAMRRVRDNHKEEFNKILKEEQLK